MSDLVLENVTRRFGGVDAVKDLSLTLSPGGVTGLIGPNGAGKSTVVNLISGVLHLSGGRVLLDGRDISTLESPEIARAGVARTFQSSRLLRDESVLDNVLVGFHIQPRPPWTSRWLGLPRARAQERDQREQAQALLERFGLAGQARASAGSLSYGHQRRLEMARALALRPRVILLDEPVAGMNDAEASELGDIFRTLASDGLTIVLIEHNIRFVAALCHRVHVLDSGRLLASGSADEILRNEAVIRAYLGSGDA